MADMVLRPCPRFGFAFACVCSLRIMRRLNVPKERIRKSDSVNTEIVRATHPRNIYKSMMSLQKYFHEACRERVFQMRDSSPSDAASSNYLREPVYYMRMHQNPQICLSAAQHAVRVDVLDCWNVVSTVTVSGMLPSRGDDIQFRYAIRHPGTTYYTTLSLSVYYKGPTSLRTVSPVISTSLPLHAYNFRPAAMQFFKSTILLVVAFVTFAAAAPSGETREAHWIPGQCKPLLQSCNVNSECCGDLCVLGVIILTYCTQLHILINLVISQLCA